MREKMTCVPAEPMSMPTRRQRDVVLDPDRVLFQRLVVVEVEMIVVVVGVAVVRVHEVLAEQVVGERVARFLVVFVVGIGHSSLLRGGAVAVTLGHMVAAAVLSHGGE